MLEYQKKLKVRKVMYSNISFVFLLVCIILLAKGVIGIYSKAHESEKNKLTAELEYGKLSERDAVVSAQISDLKTSEGVEKEIRNKFNVTKEGEQMVVIVQKKEDTSIANENVEEKGFINWLKSLFSSTKKE